MAVDETLTPGAIRSLALQSRGLRASVVRFVTAAYRSNPLRDGEYVVRVDRPRVKEMFAAIDNDQFETCTP